MNKFEQSISNIKQHNPNLSKKLENFKVQENILKLSSTNSGNPNLVYNEINIHSSQNPVDEAIEEFRQLMPEAKDIVILVGLGLGYTLKSFFVNSKSKIIVYEPNLQILNFSLNSVDFTEELSSGRVFIASSTVELNKILEDKYAYKDKIKVSAIKSSELLYQQELQALNTIIPNITSSLESNFNTLFAKSSLWLFWSLQHLSEYKEAPPIKMLENKFKGKTALIVSAGPSLDANIDIIKNNKDKFIIFCTNIAYKKLINNGITPDFTVYIDTTPFTESVSNYEHSKTNLILHSNSWVRTITDIKANKSFTFYCKNDLVSRWIADRSGFSIEKYRNKGTVSYCALLSAYNMGCNPIIMTGQDLAYTNGKLYSSGSFWGDYTEVNAEKQTITGTCKNIEKNNKVLNDKISSLKNSKLVQVKGQNGELLASSPDYAGFIQHFEEFALDNNSDGLTLFNASTGGANIEGFENKTLEEIIDKLTPINININNFIEEITYSEKNPIKENYSQIKAESEKIIESVKKSMTLSNQGLGASKKLYQELKKRQLNPSNISKLANKILQSYKEIDEILLQKWDFMLYLAFKEIMEFNMIMEDQSKQSEKTLFLNLATGSKKLFEKLYEKLEVINRAYLKKVIDA